VTVSNGLLLKSGIGQEDTGAGILSFGDLTITDSNINSNVAGSGIGGVAQLRADTNFSMRNSHVSGNTGNPIGGAVACCGSVSISDTSFSANIGTGLQITGHGASPADVTRIAVVQNFGSRFGGVVTFGDVVISNSTIGQNFEMVNRGGGGIFVAFGNLTLVNVTVAGNRADALAPDSAAGLFGDPVNAARIELFNTILAGNVTLNPATGHDDPSDCRGAPITSRGHNLIGSTAGCTITLLASDLVGQASGLANLDNQAVPGKAHFVMLSTGAGINAGDNAVCKSNPLLTTDQIGNPRVGICDIGAIEFQGLVSTFAGTPGTPSCHGDSVSALVRQWGNLPAAASALGYPHVQALQDAIKTFCRE
jgi:hypothetical protein